MNKEEKRHPCVHCGWAMGERDGEPLCEHCKEKRREGFVKENENE